VLVFEDVTRRFGRATALEGVTLAFDAKTTTALLGPNGSGKTTLLRLAAALDRPSRGAVRLDGRDLREDAASRARIGYAGHDAALYDALTALENVAFRAKLLGRNRAGAEAASALDLAGFPARGRDLAAGALSRGQRQRVALARAFVGEPDIVLLDEPHAGLDEDGAAALDRALAGLAARGATVLVATHDAPRLGALVDRAVALERGRVARDEPRRNAP